MRLLIFSDDDIRAIVTGRKTQTRRVIEPQPPVQSRGSVQGVFFNNLFELIVDAGEELAVAGSKTVKVNQRFLCPYGKPGDCLWIREGWRTEELEDGLDGIRYQADERFRPIENTFEASNSWCEAHQNGKHGDKWRSPMHMPRWASRIALGIISICAERLQELTDADALAEGVHLHGTTRYAGEAVDGFVKLWDSANGERHPWESNPWVWKIEFVRLAIPVEIGIASTAKKDLTEL
ncbi:MAG: hypothetical protein BWY63_03198 [Chloroflexi bacterium ADurb.Bin360]|nr:MAG: hypothetical protein BWY63_03198 [Chloroflexi bacterium ADurb.Bin360]